MAAEARVRDLAAAIQLSQEALAKASETLHHERTRYEAGTERFGPGLAAVSASADDPAALGDAAAPAEPTAGPWAESRSGLWIHILGGTRIEIDGQPVHGAWLAQRAGQLLGLLVLNRSRSVPGEEIAEALRSSSGVVSPGTVRSIVHELRDKLEPSRSRRSGSRFLLAGPTGYRLALTTVTTDVEEFEALARVGLARGSQADDARISMRALERAIELYGGELLAEFRYAEWAFLERERVALIAAECFRRLAELHAARGNLDYAIALLDRLVALDPLDGPSQRALIALCLRSGRYGRAHRQYSLFQARLQREFGERPEFDLAELFAEHV